MSHRSSVVRRFISRVLVTTIVGSLLATVGLLVTSATPAAAASNSYLKSITFVEDLHDGSVACPAGTSKDGTDANDGVSGYFIFACWTFTDDATQALHGISVNASGSSDYQCPSGLSEVTKPDGSRIDLNHGAGGDFVRVCTTSDDTFGPAIENADIVRMGSGLQFLCSAAGTGNHPGYMNAGESGHENLAAFGTGLNSGINSGFPVIHLCYNYAPRTFVQTTLNTSGTTGVYRYTRWFSESEPASTYNVSCPDSMYALNWRNSTPSSLVTVSQNVAPNDSTRQFVMANFDASDSHRGIIDLACSKYRYPTTGIGAGGDDSSCGGEGQPACTGAIKVKGWRSENWEYQAHPFWSCDRGLIIDEGTADAICKDLTRHDHQDEKNSWETWAMKQQNNTLGADEPINFVPLLQSHESYDNQADSYPLVNQFRSMSDQLDMGVRWLDLRPRWAVGTGAQEYMRLSHGNNECTIGCSAVDRPYYDGIEEVGKWLDDNPGEFLMISANSTGHDLDGQDEEAVRAYLTDPLLKYIGADKILGPKQWCDTIDATVPAGVADVQRGDPATQVFETTCDGVPHNNFSDHFDPYRWPTRAEMNAMGKRVIVVTDAETDLTFSTDLDHAHKFGNDFARKFDAATCRMEDITTKYGDDTGFTMTKPDYYSSFPKVFETRNLGGATTEGEGFEIDWNAPADQFLGNLDGRSDAWPGYLYAYTNEIPDGNGGNVNRPYADDASSVEQLADCNVHVQLDMLGNDNRFNGTNAITNKDNGDSHADRRDGMIWTWRSGDYGQPNTCAVMDADDARFESRGCGESHQVACATPASSTVGYRQGDPYSWASPLGDDWKVTANSYTWDHAFDGCATEFPGRVAAVPTNKMQANSLRTVSGAVDVWLAYTNRSADGQWAIQRTPPPVIDYTLTHPDGTDYVAGTWTNKDVVATFSCRVADGRTVATNTLSPSITLSTEGENQSVSPTGSCTDNTGNSSFGIVVPDIDIDKTFPNVGTEMVSPAANAAGWRNTDVTVSRPCTDALSGTDTPTLSSTLTTEGTTSVTLSCTDRAGNTQTATGQAIKLDKTKPSVTQLNATTSPNSAGWYKSNVTIQGVCADAGSGVDVTAPSTTLSSDGANQTATVTCTDHAGNTGSATKTGIKIDKTAPTLSPLSSSPVANVNGWRNQSVTVSGTCSDVTSGPVQAAPSTVVGGDGDNLSGTVSCVDLAGNQVSATATGIKIDTTAPTIGDDTVSPAANTKGWNKANVTVTRPCTDTLSGVLRSTETSTVSTEGTNQTVTLTCTDKAGNTKSADTTNLNLDKTAPTVTVAPITSPDGTNSWYKTNPTLRTTGTDLLSLIDSCTADAPWTGGDTVGTTVKGKCSDNAGNETEVSSAVFKVDTTPPTVVVAPTTAPNGTNGWYKTNPMVGTTGTDATSGIASCSANGPWTGGDTATAAPSGSCTDNAGNSTTKAATPFKVDTAKPSVACPATPVFLLRQSPATMTPVVTDALSGPAPASSSVADTSGVGTFPITLTGLDLAGNSARAACTYNVTYGVQVTGPALSSPQIAGGPVSFDIKLVDADGRNVSSNSITLTVVPAPGINSLIWTGSSWRLTRGTSLTPGTYAVQFRASGDPIAHSFEYQTSRLGFIGTVLGL